MLLPQSRWRDRRPVKGLIAHCLLASTRISTPVALAATAFALVALGLTEAWFGERWSLGLVAYLPAAFAAWRLGLASGVMTGIGSALLWWALAKGTPMGAGALALVWNVAARAGSSAVVAIFVAEMRGLFERERGLAQRCHLTGAFSGRAFRDVLEDMLIKAARHRQPVALLYIDLDDFKQVNDQFGHAEGDARLLAFANAISSVLGTGDHLARTGGDEFVVLLTGHDGAERAAIDRVRGEALRSLASGNPPLSASMGAVIAPAGMSIEAGDFVRRADAAMYEGKRAGKGKLVVFDLGAPARLSAAA